MDNKALNFLLCILMGLLAACATPSARDPAATTANNNEWDAYEKSYDDVDLQSACKPRQLLPPKGVHVRGKVIALHGFTACPQQFFDWAKTLTQKGFIVQLMLLPGHGRLAELNGKDNIKDVPGNGNTMPYYDFADRVIKIARADRLATTLAGISTGGTIAVQAALKDPGAFEKLILFSPYFAASSIFYRNILPVGGQTPLLNTKIISWGPSCLNEMSRGRAGVCTFKLHQLQSVQKFGKTMANTAIPFYPKVQIVGVTQDKAASTEYIQKAAKNLGWILDKEGSISVCLYKNGANHSLLSKYDSPDENKFWLTSMLKDSTHFVENGKFFPTNGDSGEFGLPSCVVQK